MSVYSNIKYVWQLNWNSSEYYGYQMSSEDVADLHLLDNDPNFEVPTKSINYITKQLASKFPNWFGIKIELENLMDTVLEVMPKYIPLRFTAKVPMNQRIVEFLQTRADQWRKVNSPKHHAYDQAAVSAAQTTQQITAENAMNLHGVGPKIYTRICKFLEDYKPLIVRIPVQKRQRESVQDQPNKRQRIIDEYFSVDSSVINKLSDGDTLYTREIPKNKVNMGIAQHLAKCHNDYSDKPHLKYAYENAIQAVCETDLDMRVWNKTRTPHVKYIGEVMGDVISEYYTNNIDDATWRRVKPIPFNY